MRGGGGSGQLTPPPPPTPPPPVSIIMLGVLPARLGWLALSHTIIIAFAYLTNRAWAEQSRPSPFYSDTKNRTDHKSILERSQTSTCAAAARALPLDNDLAHATLEDHTSPRTFFLQYVTAGSFLFGDKRGACLRVVLHGISVCVLLQANLCFFVNIMCVLFIQLRTVANEPSTYRYVAGSCTPTRLDKYMNNSPSVSRICSNKQVQKGTRRYNTNNTCLFRTTQSIKKIKKKHTGKKPRTGRKIQNTNKPRLSSNSTNQRTKILATKLCIYLFINIMIEYNYYPKNVLAQPAETIM